MTKVAVSIVTPGAVLAAVRADLQISGSSDADALGELIAQALRRLCGFMCPCAPRSILLAASRSLASLVGDEVPLQERIDAVFEHLLTAGDIVEVARVSTLAPADDRTQVFCGPPSFLQCDARCYIFGIAPDDAPFLPKSLRDRLHYDGSTRFLDALKGEDLDETLSALGLRRHSVASWLGKSSRVSAQTFLQQVQNRLERDGVKGVIPGLKILQHAGAAPSRYASRWREPGDAAGLYIGRADQEFGTAVWYLASLVDGIVARSMVLPLSEAAGRACDQAWRIQLAIDASRGHPATYAVRPAEGGMRLGVSFPLPAIAKRQLLYLGGMKGDADGRQFSYWLPDLALRLAEDYLQSEFWLRPDPNMSL
ncbi:hypothetical protein [Metallibacterium sp.]|uniref:hypothetical protein n=1 Tax=Metallibacterium sp. TaxID=2940281 RepID=UPI00260A6A2F|nr:hypothetical protein [Metallibacterium sp.]